VAPITPATIKNLPHRKIRRLYKIAYFRISLQGPIFNGGGKKRRYTRGKDKMDMHSGFSWVKYCIFIYFCQYLPGNYPGLLTKNGNFWNIYAFEAVPKCQILELQL
jgi:hypothetical protein